MNLPYNVLAVDLNEPDLIEDQSFTNPKRYGGGACVNREFLRKYDNFYIAAREKCFENVPPEKRKQCIVLTEEEICDIREGFGIFAVQSLKDIIFSIDIIFHQFTNRSINTVGLKARNVVWAVGVNDTIHPNNSHLALYSPEHQRPIIYNDSVKIYKVVIGKPLPEFKERKKEDYLFQCSRHNAEFGTTEIAHWCKENKVTGVFAGPIDANFNLLDFVDDKYVNYLGLISEEDKLEWTKGARLYTLNFKWDAPFNLSMIESLSLGTPVFTNSRGFTRDVIQDGVNGFLDKPLKHAWENADKLSQRAIWESAQPYSSEKMIASFEDTFKIVLS
jgi:glycosyltransferase involved in cell wall biosynthesis